MHTGVIRLDVGLFAGSEAIAVQAVLVTGYPEAYRAHLKLQSATFFRVDEHAHTGNASDRCDPNQVSAGGNLANL